MIGDRIGEDGRKELNAVIEKLGGWRGRKRWGSQCGEANISSSYQPLACLALEMVKLFRVVKASESSHLNKGQHPQ